MNIRTPLAAFLLLSAAALPAQACYTVHDAAGRIVYRSAQAPVDMSRPLHDTLPQRFPGGHLVFDTTDSCDAIVSGRPQHAAGAAAPLLTDRHTAQALGLRYAAMAGNVVMVQPRDAAVVLAGRMPVNVIPPVVAPSLLAGAVPPDTARMGGPASGRVITELRDPPVTIIEGPGGVTGSVGTR